jgi:hypothetical protein
VLVVVPVESCALHSVGDETQIDAFVNSPEIASPSVIAPIATTMATRIASNAYSIIVTPSSR